MSAERMKVLEMLAQGKITAEDADKLLEKLAAQAVDSSPSAGKSRENTAPQPKPRYLRIQVEKPGQEHVNLRMPLAFLGKGKRLLAVLPTRVSERLSEQGLDVAAFSALDDGALAEAIENTNIEIDKGDGKKVRIFCE